MLLLLRSSVEQVGFGETEGGGKACPSAWCEKSTQEGLVGSQLAPSICSGKSLPLPVSEASPLRPQGRWWVVRSPWVAPESSLTSPRSGLTVSDTGKAPLQRALQVPVPHFLDQSGKVLQPTR